MIKFAEKYVESFMAKLIAKNPGESEFHQAVKEVLTSVAPCLEAYPHLMDSKIMERMVEPERMIMFRVPWMDDKGEIQINRGYRVQMNSAIGPYKGGIRFHKSVNLSIMKDIHAACLKYGTEENGYINYVKGANIAGFIKVANAMIEQGLVNSL